MSPSLRHSAVPFAISGLPLDCDLHGARYRHAAGIIRLGPQLHRYAIDQPAPALSADLDYLRQAVDLQPVLRIDLQGDLLAQ